MIKTSVEEKLVMKLEKHLKSKGLDCSILPDGTMDFEYDYPRVPLDGPVEGIASRGVMKVNNCDIDFLDVVKQKKICASGLAPGGIYGMGVNEATTWKIRFFMSFPPTLKIGPLKIGTITKIEKGAFHSKVEDYIWNGYGKLTTLPPGMVYDDVMGALEEDKKLRELMMKCLLKEVKVTVDVYTPKRKVEYDHLQYVRDDSIWYRFKPKKESYAKILITSGWKPQKDLFIDETTIQMYKRIATNIKKAVERVRYHLEQKSAAD